VWCTRDGPPGVDGYGGTVFIHQLAHLTQRCARSTLSAICHAADKQITHRGRNFAPSCCKLRYRMLVASSRRSPAGRQLAIELRELRTRAGRTVADVAAAMGWSTAKLSRIENAVNGIGGRDLSTLLELYKVDKVDRARINGLVTRVGHARPRITYGSTLPDVLEELIALEIEATTISTYGAIVVPGLLQTPEYAGAINAAALRGADAAQDVLTARMARQAVLARQPPPRLNVVIDEAVLCRPVGAHDVLKRQMLRLIEASDRPKTSIRVLPFAVGAHPAIAGQFTLLDLDDETTPTYVFCDGLTGGVMRNTPEDVHSYRLCFEAINTLALSKEKSVEKFTAVASGDYGE
jgi:transcriptional regulator with XRE-family HTH domain